MWPLNQFFFFRFDLNETNVKTSNNIWFYIWISPDNISCNCYTSVYYNKSFRGEVEIKNYLTLNADKKKEFIGKHLGCEFFPHHTLLSWAHRVKRCWCIFQLPACLSSQIYLSYVVYLFHLLLFSFELRLSFILLKFIKTLLDFLPLPPESLLQLFCHYFIYRVVLYFGTALIFFLNIAIYHFNYI